MAKKTTTYQEDLIEALKDPREAAAYLNAAMEEGDRALFLLALRNVAEAHGGMGAVSEKAKLNRESMYRMLSRKGNQMAGEQNERGAMISSVSTCPCGLLLE